MDELSADTLATVSAGRAAAVAQLRGLADRIEHLALTDVAEALVLLEPVLDNLRRQATLALDARLLAASFGGGAWTPRARAMTSTSLGIRPTNWGA